MSALTFYWNAPWTALSSRLTGELIAVGASGCVNSSRPESLYDLACNLDDTLTFRGVWDRTSDPVTLSVLAEDLADLHAERTGIRGALRRGFGDAAHDHI
ncbi:hypothetical protein [Streptomyces sp. NPDC093589]|uniref:hypothetical protein n=1 Tax=Streptomyces sp. NPDC093589 TaxID=3366043 RepID=UPI0037FFBFE4